MNVAGPHENASKRAFRKKLKAYQSSFDIRTFRVRSKKRAGSRTPQVATLGERISIPDSDITHVFNNEAMLAVSHAIEDMADEVGQGELISTFQRLENFAPQKKRYMALANKLDLVRVWGEGTPPKRCGKVDFVPVFHPQLNRYWIVLFQSPEQQAVLVCRQVNDAEKFEEKAFVGFYSFNPYLVESIRWRFNLVCCGLGPLVRAWEKELGLPTLRLADLSPLFHERVLSGT